MERAVAIQDNFRYREPPHFYLETRQLLGAAQLEAGLFAEAEATFKKELEKFPNNGWSLFGLYQSQLKQNKTDVAAQTKTQFEEAWEKADIALEAAVF